MICVLLLSLVVLIHSASSQSYEVSPASWMHDMRSVIGSQPLTNITLLGTHDSFAYNLSSTGSFADALTIAFGTSQIMNAYEQASAGVRYFDLRCGYDASSQAWRAYHGNYGTSVEVIIQQLRSFINSHPSEIIVIEASHFTFQSATARSAPTTDQISQLYQMINATFFPMLLPRSSGFSESIDTMIDNNHRVVVTVEQCGALIANYSLWCSGALVNTFANTNQMATMLAFNTRQMTSFNSRRATLASNNQLFKLSWTLTPTDVDITNSLINPSSPKTLQDMATLANGQWSPFLVQIANNSQIMPNLVLFDFVDEISLADFLSSSCRSNVMVLVPSTQVPVGFSSSTGTAADPPVFDVDMSSGAKDSISSSAGNVNAHNHASSHSSVAVSVVALICAVVLSA